MYRVRIYYYILRRTIFILNTIGKVPLKSKSVTVYRTYCKKINSFQSLKKRDPKLTKNNRQV